MKWISPLGNQGRGAVAAIDFRAGINGRDLNNSHTRNERTPKYALLDNPHVNSPS